MLNMSRGVSIIVFYDKTIQDAHNCTEADHKRLIESAEQPTFAESFSEYPYVSDEQLADDESRTRL